MRIADANVIAAAAHSALASTEVNETLRIWAGKPGGASPATAPDRVLLSKEGTQRHRRPADPCGFILPAAPEGSGASRLTACPSMKRFTP